MFDTYQTIFEQRADRYHEAMRRWPDARAAEFAAVLAPLGNLSGKSLCDMPAGGGYLSAHLPADADYLAVEPTALFFAACPDAPRRRRVMAPLTAVPVADAAFDAVISLAAMHHEPEVTRVLTEMRRFLKPDGHIVIADVAEGSRIDGYLNGYVNSVNSMGHEGAFLGDEFAGQVEAAGLTILTDEQVEMPWRFASRDDAGEYGRMLFGIDRANVEQVAAALEEHVGLTRDGDGYALAWTLRRVVCALAPIEI